MLSEGVWFGERKVGRERQGHLQILLAFIDGESGIICSYCADTRREMKRDFVDNYSEANWKTCIYACLMNVVTFYSKHVFLLAEGYPRRNCYMSVSVGRGWNLKRNHVYDLSSNGSCSTSARRVQWCSSPTR